MSYKAAIITGTIAAALGALIANWAGYLNLWPWIHKIGEWGAASGRWLMASSLHTNGVMCLLWLSVLVWLAVGDIVLFMLRQPQLQPTHLEYTTDMFFNVRWRWRWSDQLPYSPAPFCPRCDLQIVAAQDMFRTVLHCNDCDQTYYSGEQ